MNHEDYCSYELSKKLKDKGFDWKCDYYYNSEGILKDGGFCIDDRDIGIQLSASYFADNYNANLHIISCPTLYQAQKWLRDEKGIAINVIAHDGGFYQWGEIYLPNAPEYDGYIKPDIVQYSTYEQALSVGITKALELI